MVRLNQENGQTFVIVTHSLEVGRRAHRIVRMRDGVIEREELDPSSATWFDTPAAAPVAVSAPPMDEAA